MDNNKGFTEFELDDLDIAEEQFGLTGMTDVVCPRCGEKLIYNRVSTSYSIECEKKCGIRIEVRGL